MNLRGFLVGGLLFFGVGLNAPTRAESKLSVGLGQTEYLSPSQSTQVRDGEYSNVAITGLFQSAATTETHLELNAHLGIQCTQDCSFVEAPQAYVGKTYFDSALKLKAGRVRRDWSHFDSFWELGIVEPRHRWNYLHPLHVGLTGFFAELEASPDLQLTAYATPLYVPERGVPIENSGGQVDSASPWFLHPPRQIRFADESTQVRYSLKLPSIPSILFHPAAGLELKKSLSKNSWAKVAYAYKPMNQLALGVDALFNLGTLEVNVDLYPRVVYHHLLSAEIGMGDEKNQVWLAALHEIPVRDATPARWTTQEFAKATALSVGAQAEGPALWTERRIKYQAGLLRVWGGNARDRSPFAMSGPSQFELRYPYETAALAGLMVPLFAGKSQLLESTTRLLLDLGNRGSLLSVSLGYHPSSSWLAEIGADILGGDPSKTNNYLAQYRANDRVYGRISYEF